MNESTTAEPLASPAASSKPSSGASSTRRVVLLIVIPVLVGIGAAWVYLSGGRFVETENAYVKADKVPVSARLGGQIVEVAVAENQRVSAGDLLFRIDPAPLRLAVAKAEAKLAQARTDLAALKASYREKQAEVALARTRQGFASKDAQRQADLLSKRFISPSRYDDAKQNADLATAQIAALEQDLHRIAESLGGRVDLPVESHPAYRAAQAELEQAQLDLSHCDVTAPQDGVVSKPPKVGQFVAVGTAALALVGSEPWVEANFTETDLTWVQPGQPVTVHVDTYPDVVWHGTVDSLSPATGAEFSLIPTQNASGNWVKVVQRLPVRIHLTPSAGQPPLRAGLSALVEIDTGHKRQLPWQAG